MEKDMECWRNASAPRRRRQHVSFGHSSRHCFGFGGKKTPLWQCKHVTRLSRQVCLPEKGETRTGAAPTVLRDLRERTVAANSWVLAT